MTKPNWRASYAQFRASQKHPSVFAETVQECVAFDAQSRDPMLRPLSTRLMTVRLRRMGHIAQFKLPLP